jgi:hypothetical protein
MPPLEKNYYLVREWIPFYSDQARRYQVLGLLQVTMHALIASLCVDFFSSCEGHPAGGTVSSLMDQGLRGLWGKHLAMGAPTLGTPLLGKWWQSSARMCM